jgi:hypothetical protein
MISLSIEQLRSGHQRVTSRVDGRTVRSVDMPVIDRLTAIGVLRAAAFAHECAPGVFDLTHIRLNDAARLVLNPEGEGNG